MSQPTPPMPDFPPPSAPKKNHTNAIIIGTAAVLIAAIVTTGVVVADSDDSSGDNPTVAKAANTSPPASASSTPSVTPEQPELKIGDTADISGEADVTAAVLGYKDTGVKGVPEMLSSGQKWAVLDVKVCNTGSEPVQTSTFPWSLAYEGGVRIDSAGMNAGELPQPLYPMDAKVATGDCVRGNIAFQVPKEGRPERVLYSPGMVEVPVEWQVPKE